MIVIEDNTTIFLSNIIEILDSIFNFIEKINKYNK
jgi:hypothetical protein